jgi:hypothetical protein
VKQVPDSFSNASVELPLTTQVPAARGLSLGSSTRLAVAQAALAGPRGVRYGSFFHAPCVGARRVVDRIVECDAAGCTGQRYEGGDLRNANGDRYGWTCVLVYAELARCRRRHLEGARLQPSGVVEHRSCNGPHLWHADCSQDALVDGLRSLRRHELHRVSLVLDQGPQPRTARRRSPVFLRWP